MKNYRNSEIETFFRTAKESENTPCEVRIGNGKIVVSYRLESGPEVWEGGDDGTGHFALKLSNASCRATLHLTSNGETLEGSWFYEGEYGMWRIDLNGDD